MVTPLPSQISPTIPFFYQGTVKKTQISTKECYMSISEHAKLDCLQFRPEESRFSMSIELYIMAALPLSQPPPLPSNFLLGDTVKVGYFQETTITQTQK